MFNSVHSCRVGFLVPFKQHKIAYKPCVMLTLNKQQFSDRSCFQTKNSTLLEHVGVQYCVYDSRKQKGPDTGPRSLKQNCLSWKFSKKHNLSIHAQLDNKKTTTTKKKCSICMRLLRVVMCSIKVETWIIILLF